MTKQEQETLQLTVKEAHSLLATLRYSVLSPVLRDPDFAMLTALAFAGFRVDANGFANPIVRRRLADEAVRNTDFAKKLRELAAAVSVVPVAAMPSRPASPSVAASREAPSETEYVRATQAYRAERDRLKRERDEEADRRRAAEAGLAQARLDAMAADAARNEAVRDLDRARQRAERLERKLRRAEVGNAELRKALAGSGLNATHSGIERAASESRSHGSAHTPRAEHEFIDAVRRLSDKPNSTAGRQIAAEVLRCNSLNQDALDILASAALSSGDTRAAAASWRTLLTLQIGCGLFEAAAQTLLRLFAAAPDARAAHEFLAALAQSSVDLDEIRSIFDRLRSTAPEIHQLLRKQAQGDLAVQLFTDRSRAKTGADDVLPITLPAAIGRVATARLITGWIDRNDVAAVAALRSAITATPETDRAVIATALDAFSDGNSSYYRLLAVSSIAGSVLVDASNVAWHGQDMVSNPRPRVAQILAVRRALRTRGYFPVLLIADANLPHVVDDPAVVRRMIDAGELALVTSGTDADEYILREAQRLGASIVSNDYMADWDPDQKASKLQFSIAHGTGVASIYE